MNVIQLYRTINAEGKTTSVSPRKPEEGTYFEDRYRIVADPNKELWKDGVNYGVMLDVDSLEGWSEKKAENQ